MHRVPLNHGAFALVDDCDVEVIAGHKWYVTAYGYAATNVLRGNRRTLLYMHRLLLGEPKGMDIDHIDGHKLHNFRSNLRICTSEQNKLNRGAHLGRADLASHFKGVFWHAGTKKWRAKIGHEKRSIHLGLFADEVSAARAYNQAAKRLFGEFAWLNPLPQENSHALQFV